MTAIASAKLGALRFLFADTLLSGPSRCAFHVELPDRRVTVPQIDADELVPFRCASKLNICGKFAIAWSGDLAPAASALSTLHGIHENGVLKLNDVVHHLNIAATPDEEGKRSSFIYSYFEGSRPATAALSQDRVCQIYGGGQTALAYGSGAQAILKVIQGIAGSDGNIAKRYRPESDPEGVQHATAFGAATAVAGRMIGLNCLLDDAFVKLGVGGIYETAFVANHPDGNFHFRAIDEVAYALWEVRHEGNMDYNDPYKNGSYANLRVQPTCICCVQYCGSTPVYLRAKACGCHDCVIVHPAHKLPYEIDLVTVEKEIAARDWTPNYIVDIMVDRWCKIVHVGMHRNRDSFISPGPSSGPTVSVGKTKDGLWRTEISAEYCEEMAGTYARRYVREGVSIGWQGSHVFGHLKKPLGK